LNRKMMKEELLGGVTGVVGRVEVRQKSSRYLIRKLSLTHYAVVSCRYSYEAVGKMRNCFVRNADGKMRNGMCGATVIGRDP